MFGVFLMSSSVSYCVFCPYKKVQPKINKRATMNKTLMQCLTQADHNSASDSLNVSAVQ